MKPTITTDLVRALIAEQFPQWSDLPVTPVPRQGWDNRTFRLGDQLSVRLPSAEGYVPAVEKENRWLPELAGHLPLPVPSPVAVGRPGAGYPYPWSVRQWLTGDTLEDAAEVDRLRLARDLGEFLTVLRQAPVAGPPGGRHSFFRGCHPSAYADGVEQALKDLGDAVDVPACRAVWAEALDSAWESAPVWFHGDIAVGNLLVRDGRLAAVIDFGTCGVGDPACDLVIAWNTLAGAERAAFRDAVGLDRQTWQRARGWALWKALIMLAEPGAAPAWRQVVDQVLADPGTA
ncbi:aminoglycoside phosphotransferase family protein [Actinoplanes sp. NPDC048967]|uniref:aminoglycoside phosphotransferase family protein n=1 Tax=Actinoplanes sp. NPDC048967 TaxID=3155269 RepID=UPI0033E59F43